MPVVTQHIKWRRPRNQFRHRIAETDPSPQLSPIIQSTRCKSTISSLLSTFSNTISNETTHARSQNRKQKKKNSITSSNSNGSCSAGAFRGLGCTAGASQQVSVPAVVQFQSSADWQGKKNRKKKHMKKNSIRNRTEYPCHGSATCVDFQDVWCGPGIGFSSDTSVDCVVARKNVTSRAKLDAERITNRERPSNFGRRMVNPESVSFLSDDSDVFTVSTGLESLGNARFYRHHNIPNPSTDDLAQIVKIQGRLMGGRFTSNDQFRDWRLDIDNMSYEQLLELGERIGYVNTGVKEDEMGLNIRKLKLFISNDASKHQLDRKCTICQEEYESDDELGKLNCEHCYHFQCIKQWIVLKNFCPVCKQEVVVRH